MLNLEWYRTFKHIFEAGSLTAASKRLRMTQPGVSKHLAALEGHIGKPLFERTGRKILPTEFGKYLFTQIEAPITLLEKAEAHVHSSCDRQCPSIVIGCTTDLFTHKLRERIDRLEMNISVQFGDRRSLADSLEKEEIHLTVGTEKYHQYSHQFVPFDSQRLLLIASNKLRVPEEFEVNKSSLMAWLAEQTWYSDESELTLLYKYWKSHFQSQPKFGARYILPSFEEILKVMQSSPGLCVIPDYACENALERGEIHQPFPVCPLIEEKLYFAYKPNSPQLYEIQCFLRKEREQLAIVASRQNL